MNTTHQLNGSLNGNGNHSPNRVSKTAKLNYGRYIQAVTRTILWTFLAIAASFGIWFAYLQATTKPPIDPRTERIKKSIETLYDAIDVLRNELPSEDDDEAHDYTSPYLR